MFRSFTASTLMGYIFAVSVLNYHGYAVSSISCLQMMYCYFMLHLFCLYRLVFDKFASRIYFVLYVLFSFLFIFSHEYPLDHFVFLVLALPFCCIILFKLGYGDRILHLVCAVAVFSMLSVVYLLIKIKYGMLNQGVGYEHDVVFNHKYLVLIFEDVISNYFTYFFKAVSYFFPSGLFESNAFSSLAREELISGRGLAMGVGDEFSKSLVISNYIYIWRYWAGFFCFPLVMLLYLLVRRNFTFPTKRMFLIFFAVFSVFVGQTVHYFIKWDLASVFPSDVGMLYRDWKTIFFLEFLLVYFLSNCFNKFKGGFRYLFILIFATYWLWVQSSKVLPAYNLFNLIQHFGVPTS